MQVRQAGGVRACVAACATTTSTSSSPAAIPSPPLRLSLMHAPHPVLPARAPSSTTPAWPARSSVRRGMRLDLPERLLHGTINHRMMRTATAFWCVMRDSHIHCTRTGLRVCVGGASASARSAWRCSRSGASERASSGKGVLGVWRMQWRNEETAKVKMASPGQRSGYIEERGKVGGSCIGDDLAVT